MEAVMKYLKDHEMLNRILQFFFSTLIALAVLFIVLRVSRKLFLKLRSKKTGVNVVFGEKIFRFVVIFLCIMWIIMSNDLTKSFGQSLFQSTAVIAAIAGFAAQSVLSDLICGIIISSTKPFAVGDRIELESGIAGVVKDMTLRHVVLQGLDTQTYVIPNSKVNSQYVKNMSYRNDLRSVDFHFSVSYDTDPSFAAGVIRQAIMESPYSVPGKHTSPGAAPDYAPVYFIAFRDSCLDMNTTGYFRPDTPTERFRDDINTRVWKALAANHIEIPYNYMNVLVGQRDS